ncbi:condensin II complex subunit CAP-H2 or CNDH2 [Nitzschia inconspicua]|uniref:Condensin II complex subunit CAP-H2 or CNDH2 n=1 Tax=Nitzschia inconspicua TaxID=303405 RepID=A0A9K3LDZ5_9STRA|nr:condensin II complex subunit CAP-H2 or CNDH2 [Nitzschia inconspicua]
MSRTTHTQSGRDASSSILEPNIHPLSSSASNNAMELALQTLQPIRDLSRNWDVDIASCLEEYLQELTGLTSAVGSNEQNGIMRTDDPHDGSSTSTNNGPPNFAHAALILQNSSHVYSRKVEYLHSLVYKALQEFFQSTAAAKNSNSNRRNMADSDIEDFFEFDPHENFLLLDDVVPEDVTHRKINLKDEDETVTFRNGHCETTPFTSEREKDVSSGNTKNNTTRLSLGGLSVTRLERSSFGGGVSSTGSLQQQRALLGILNNGSLRLMRDQCDVDDNGVLLMPGSRTIGRHVVGDGGRRESTEDFPIGQPKSLFGNDFGKESPSKQHEGETAALDNFDDNDDDGPGFVMNDDTDEEVHHSRASLSVVDKDKVKRVTFVEEAPPLRSEKRTDPWELFDPHSIMDPSYSAKPLKMGKTIRLPDGITKPPSECVTGARTTVTSQLRVQSLKVPNARPSLAVEIFRVAMGEQPETLVHISNHGLAYGNEFLHSAKEHAKRMAAQRRLEKKNRQEPFRQGRSAILERDFNSGHDFDDGDDDFGDFGGPNDDYDDEGNNEGGNVGFESVDDVIRGSDDNDRYGSKTFEELCRAHIEAFAKGAEKYAMSTKLTERVGEWQEKLAPILAEEEQRGSFDIHHYSEKLIENASEGALLGKRKSDGSMQVQAPDGQSSVDFSVVTKGCTRNDVCRFFLASLSLANAGNLEIQDDSEGFCFRLISLKLERPMESYRAPSLVSER